MNELKRIKEKLKANETVFGTSISLTDSCVTEQMGLLGFDFVWIDMEHTAIGKKEVLEHIIAAKAAGVASFVRVPWNDPVLLKPILEMGADGIIVPYIRNLEEAKLAISACYYPPKGIRGFGPIRAADYGGYDCIEYINNYEGSFLRMIQIECISAVECLEDIVKIDGLDAIIVGPMDLSASIGKLGKVRDPEVMEIIDRIGNIAQESGIPLGVSLSYSPVDLKEWINRGVKIMSIDSDMAFTRIAAKEILKEAKELCVK